MAGQDNWWYLEEEQLLVSRVLPLAEHCALSTIRMGCVKQGSWNRDPTLGGHKLSESTEDSWAALDLPLELQKGSWQSKVDPRANVKRKESGVCVSGGCKGNPEDGNYQKMGSRQGTS